MPTKSKLRNKRLWQEIGSLALLACIIAVPTMAVIAFNPIQQWQNVRQDYGSGTAYALLAVFVILTTILAAPGIAWALQTRGRMDWLLGKGDYDDPDEVSAK